MTPEEARKASKLRQKASRKQHGIASYPTMIQQQAMTGKPFTQTQQNLFRAVQQKKGVTSQTKYAKANQINLVTKTPWNYFWEDDKWRERRSHGGGGGGGIQT